MSEIKLYVIKIIAVAAVVQLGGIFISRKSYQRLYRLIGGIFIILTMISFPHIKEYKLSVETFDEVYETEYTNKFLETQFTEKVSRKIADDIRNIYGVECDVAVSTNEEFSRLLIEISGEYDENNIDSIRQHVIQNFCTQNDEVILINDGN